MKSLKWRARRHEQILSCHLSRLWNAEQEQQRRRDICENTIAQSELVRIGGDVDELHEVGGVSSVGRAIGVAHQFAIAVIGGDERFAAERE